MIRRIATVGGLTLVSRLTGFVRDVVMAAILGAGPIADAFFIAFRLPNHFRAILAEGAFNAAFVPAYARTLEKDGKAASRRFADQIAAALLAINIVLLALALLFTPYVVGLLAPGLSERPGALHPCRRAHPHHLPGSAAGLDPDHDRGRAQRQWTLRGGGGGADPAQHLHDHRAPVRGLVPERGLCRGLGRPGRGRRAGDPGGGRRRASPFRPAAPHAAARPADAEVLEGAGARHHRRGRRAACAVRRHADRLVSAGRRAVGALLRRPHQPASHRRGRHRRGHRALAGDVAAPCRRRREGRGVGASPRHPARAPAHRAVRRGGAHHSGSDHARVVRPRRVHRSRCGGRRRHARRLLGRAPAVRPFAEFHRAVLRPPRYRDAGQGGASGRGHQCRA